MDKRAFDDILAAFLITYALAAFSFEKYIPDKIAEFMQALVFIAFALSWLWLSFKNGKKSGAAFPIFAAAFWLLPQLIIYIANNGPEIFRMSIVMYVLSEFFDFLTVVPMKITGSAAGISAYGAMAVILLLCAVCYLFGLFMEEDQQSGS